MLTAVKIQDLTISTQLGTVTIENGDVFVEDLDKVKSGTLTEDDYHLSLETLELVHLMAAVQFVNTQGASIKTYARKLTEEEKEGIKDFVWVYSGVRTTQMSDPDAVKALEKTVENYKGRKI